MGDIYWGTSGALNAKANPSLLFLGDSWFWYPIGNLPLAIHPHFSQHDFLVIGKNGADAYEWKDKLRKDIETTFKFYAKSSQALMLSGGGNDVAGTADFLRIISDNCSKATTVNECYRPGQPDNLIALLYAAYKGVIVHYRSYNTVAPIFMHNYDNAWPTGKGFFGPSDWLKVPMDKAKVPQNLRRDLFKDLVSKLRDAQLQLTRDKSLGKLVALKTTGTMPEDASQKENWWANELHPTIKGFKLIADKRFIPEIKKFIAP